MLHHLNYVLRYVDEIWAVITGEGLQPIMKCPIPQLVPSGSIIRQLLQSDEFVESDSKTVHICLGEVWNFLGIMVIEELPCHVPAIPFSDVLAADKVGSATEAQISQLILMVEID